MQDDEQQIRDLVTAWMAATKAGDVETVLSLMSEDVIFLVPGQPVMRKPEYAAAARAMAGPDGPRFDGASDIQEIQLIGDWAFMWSRLSVQVTPPHGAPLTRREGHTLTIFHKQAGRWLLARDANLLVTVSP